MTHHTFRHILIGLLGLCLSIVPAFAVDTGTAPAVIPASQTPDSPTVMKVVVASVSGLVQVREAEDQPWKQAVVDMELTEGAEFRTGPRSSVTCVIPPDQSFTLDRLGTIKIAEAMKSGNKIKTDLMMKYGRTRYDIEAAGVEHESTIRSPSSTLAVRGTRVQLYDQPPFVVQAASFTGKARFGYAKRVVSVGGKSWAKVEAGKDSAADTALASSVVDPRCSAARSATDIKLIESEVSRGGILSYDPITNIPVIRGGAGPLSDLQLAKSLPGELNFVLRWGTNSDINLLVTNEPGKTDAILSKGFQPTEILFPGFNLDRVPSGGRIAFDHRGGPNGGQEIAYWPGKSPLGVYGVSAIHASGAPATFKLNVYLGGELQTIFTSDLDGNTFKQKTLTGTIANKESLSGIVLIPKDQFLEDNSTSNDPIVLMASSKPSKAKITAAPIAELKPNKSVTRGR